MTVKLSGFAELDARLAALGRATAKNVVKRVLLKAAEPIREAAQAKAPRLTGTLSLSIGVSDKPPPGFKKEPGSGPVFVGREGGKAMFRSARNDQVSVYIGPTSKGGKGVSPVGMWQEFGTSKFPPHPFMRPAFDEKKGVALDIIKNEMAGEIRKAIGRKVKRDARAAAKAATSSSEGI